MDFLAWVSLGVIVFTFFIVVAVGANGYYGGALFDGLTNRQKGWYRVRRNVYDPWHNRKITKFKTMWEEKIEWQGNLVTMTRLAIYEKTEKLGEVLDIRDLGQPWQFLTWFTRYQIRIIGGDLKRAVDENISKDRQISGLITSNKRAWKFSYDNMEEFARVGKVLKDSFGGTINMPGKGRAESLSQISNQAE